MSQAQFRFSTDIIRRLGEELNPSVDQSILELVKNSYDADARKCLVTLDKVDNPGGSMIIHDDGDGMDAERITNGWLVLGKSPKTEIHKTRLGRIPAGNKGLGRLASLRMGAWVELATRPQTDPTSEYKLRIDWERFDQAETVDELSFDIQRHDRTPGSKKGTDITVGGVRHRISRAEVKRLARGILLLADPFQEDPSSFKPTLVAPEFSELEQLVAQSYFKDADFHLIATLDKNGKASASVVDWKGEELFTAKHGDIAGPGKDSYHADSVRFDLWAFILNKQSFGIRTTSLGEVRDWLSQFGGVHLYHNGLRVSPYGNPGNDWLEMNLLRVRSPEERPSTNNSIGRVSVTGDRNLLAQKTDRSGFIESDSFLQIKEFAQDALVWMAKRRLEVANKRRAAERAKAQTEAASAKEEVSKAIKALPDKKRTDVQKAFDAYDRTKDKEVKELRKEVQLYRTLSTAGITAATFAHESSGNPMKVIAVSINTIERRARKELDGKYDETLGKPIESVKASIETLGVLSTATLRLIDHQKRRVGRVEVHRVIEEVLETFHPFIVGREVKPDLALAPAVNPYLRGTDAAVETIITNLLNNSLAAFETGGSIPRRILIRTKVVDQMLELRVADNGPGIVGIPLKDIWLPGETTKPNGTGLGLTIVRDAVSDLGGTADAIEKGELGGAEFVIRLPILGA